MTEDRLAALEARIVDIETRLGISAAAATAQTTPAPAATHPLAPTSPGAGVPGRPTPPVAPLAPVAAARIPRRTWTIDEQLSTRLLAWAGGSALIIGVLFFLSLAFSRGWIGPEARVLIGLIGGGVALAAGARLFDRGDGTPALVTLGVGIGTSSLALYAATHLYDLVPPEIGLVGFAILATATSLIAIRSNSQGVAVFGLVAVSAGPIIVGASASLASLLFVAAVVVGTALLGFFRSWPWPQTLVVLVSALQINDWLGGSPAAPIAVAVIAGYWVVNILGAGGAPRNFALRGRFELPSIHAGSALIVVGVSLFSTLWLRLVLIDDELLRASALALLVVAHSLVAVPLLIRSRLRDPFGLLVAAVGLGVLAMSISLEVGGAYQPIAYIAIATALGWTAIRLLHAPTAIAAAVFGSFAVFHILLVEYREEQTSGWPFVSPEGAVIGFGVLAILFLAWSAARVSATGNSPRVERWTGRGAWSVGLVGAAALLGYASAFEFLPDGQMIAFAILALGLFAAALLFDGDLFAAPLLVVAGLALELIAAIVAGAVVAPPDRLVVDRGSHRDLVPLLNLTSAGLAVLAAGLVVASRLSERAVGLLIDAARWRAATIAAAAVVLVYLGSVALVDAFQVRLVGAGDIHEVATQAQVALSIAWVVMGAIVFGVGLVRRLRLARALGLGLLGLATLKVFVIDLSALDVSYRVLSFLGIGLVLLVSSFLASRFRERPIPQA